MPSLDGASIKTDSIKTAQDNFIKGNFKIQSTTTVRTDTYILQEIRKSGAVMLELAQNTLSPPQ